MTQQFHPWAYAPGLTYVDGHHRFVCGGRDLGGGDLGAHHGERGQVKCGQCVQWGAMQQSEADWMCT